MLFSTVRLALQKISDLQGIVISFLLICFGCPIDVEEADVEETDSASLEHRSANQLGPEFTALH